MHYLVSYIMIGGAVGQVQFPGAQTFEADYYWQRLTSQPDTLVAVFTVHNPKAATLFTTRNMYRNPEV